MNRTLANEFKGMGVAQKEILYRVNKKLKDTQYKSTVQPELSKVLNGAIAAPKQALIFRICSEYLMELKNED